MLRCDELKEDASRCLAVADWLAGDAAAVCCPEDSRRQAPAVELIVDTAGGRLAMEHTRVEPFPDQLRDDRQLMAFYRPIADAIEPDVPRDSRLVIQVCGPIPKPRRAADVQGRLTSWIRSTIPTLEAGRPGSTLHVAHAEPPAVPVAVTIYLWSADGGPTGVNAARPGKTEDERRERIAIALKRKTPKLLASAAEFEAHGVLILDNENFELTNWWLIHDALRKAASAVRRLPPTIVQLDTFGDPWAVVIHRYNAVWSDQLSWQTIDSPGPRLRFPRSEPVSRLMTLA